MIPIEKMNVQPEPWIQLPSGRFIGKFELNTPACNNFEEIQGFDDDIMLQKPNSVSRSNGKQYLTSNMFYNRRKQLITERADKGLKDIKIESFTNLNISKQINANVSKKLKIYKTNRDKNIISKTRQDRIEITNKPQNNRYGNIQRSNRTELSPKNTVISIFLFLFLEQDNSVKTSFSIKIRKTKYI